MDCIFCKIAAGKIPAHIIYEDDDWMAFLDINPYAKGHTVVIPKKHLDTILDVDDRDRYLAVVQDVARDIQAGTGMPDCTILTRCGRSAGQEVPHVHVHIVPSSPGEPCVFTRTKVDADLASVAEHIREAKQPER